LTIDQLSNQKETYLTEYTTTQEWEGPEELPEEGPEEIENVPAGEEEASKKTQN